MAGGPARPHPRHRRADQDGRLSGCKARVLGDVQSRFRRHGSGASCAGRARLQNFPQGKPHLVPRPRTANDDAVEADAGEAEPPCRLLHHRRGLSRRRGLRCLVAGGACYCTVVARMWRGRLTEVAGDEETARRPSGRAVGGAVQRRRDPSIAPTPNRSTALPYIRPSHSGCRVTATLVNVLPEAQPGRSSRRR